MESDKVVDIGGNFQFNKYYDSASEIAKMMVNDKYSLPEALGVIELAKELILESKRNSEG